MRIVVASDKFKGTATADQIVDAICGVASERGIECIGIPMADGGEGTLAALGGSNRTDWVTGPHGESVNASWRVDGSSAVIEMAEAAGLVLAGGAEANDAVGASTTGVGELMSIAVAAGVSTIVVGVGGSATTDGGWGALQAIGSPALLRDVDVMVACDVRTTFVDAAAVFGPQKGATPPEVELLTRRLESLAQAYQDDHEVDVRQLPGSGAAGGLAGGLAAFGAKLVDGFDVVARRVDLSAAVESADLVITGEGRIDAQSFDGKVVGGVQAIANEFRVPVVAIAGEVLDARIEAISLAERFGLEAAMADPLPLVALIAGELLNSTRTRGG